jgi:anti-sigma-K factor RskA
VEPNLTALRHNELRDMLGAYALGAVTAEEAAAMRAHLATCAECQAELAELWAAVDALPEGIEPLAPPLALRDRIAAAIAAEPLAPAPPPPPAPAITSRPVAPVVRPAAWWSGARPWVAAAAVLLLISAALLIWALRLRDQIQSVPAAETIALAPTDAAPGASGDVRYLPDNQLFVVDVRDLPPLAPGEVYEVWLIPHQGAPVPAGTFDRPTDRHAVIADRGQYQALAITTEPGPLGTAAPTGEIVAQAPL